MSVKPSHSGIIKASFLSFLILHEKGRCDRIMQSEVESEMRVAGISHIMDVEWAIFEPQG